MTEDDTFNRLRRISASEIYNAWENWVETNSFGDHGINVANFAKMHHYTVDEFLHAFASVYFANDENFNVEDWIQKWHKDYDRR